MNNSAFLKLGLGLKVIFFVALLGLSGCAKEPSYRVADGSQMQLSELRGNWVLINYWADWCRPCREEIPELNILHQRQEGEPIFVLGVNFDYLDGQELTDLIGEMGIEFPVLVDDPQVLVNKMAVAPNDASIGGKIISHPINIDGMPKRGPEKAPSLGEHNAEILSALGFSPDQLAQWYRDGVI